MRCLIKLSKNKKKHKCKKKKVIKDISLRKLCNCGEPIPPTHHWECQKCWDLHNVCIGKTTYKSDLMKEYSRK